MSLSLRYDDCSQIVEDHGDTIYKIIYLYLKGADGIDDIFQQVFLALVEKGPKFTDKKHQLAWLIRVAKNKSRDHYKNYWNRNTTGLNDWNLPPVKDSTNDVLEAVFSLEEKYRIVIYMYYYEGYTTGEISRILKIKEPTIRTQLKRGREKLKDLLKEVELD